jgi:two-component system chemotaxis response regulator CheB
MTTGTAGGERAQRSGRDIVVVGASAGGVEALKELVSRLPEDFPAAIFVVLHVAAATPSALPAILSRAGPLHAAVPEDGEPIVPRHIYVAPPDRHLLLQGDVVRVTLGPAENGHRPAVDPLFRSAARAAGPRVAAIVLSGVLDDGSAGLVAVKAAGGLAIVQDPAEALHAGMPTHAMDAVAVDHVLPVAEIALLLDRLAREPPPLPSGPAGSAPLDEQDVLLLGELPGERLAGTSSSLSCPDCEGVLWQTDRGARRLADRARERGHRVSSTRFELQASKAAQRAEAIRSVLLGEHQSARDAAREDERLTG